MSRIRKHFSAEFKAKVALEALKGLKTLAELSSEYSVHANQISTWKQQLQQASPEAFARVRSKEKQDQQLIDRLYQQIGQLQVELEWLKKKTNTR